MPQDSSSITIEWRGRERYQTTLARQLELHEMRRRGEGCDTLVFVEHSPVITQGKRGVSENLVVSEAVLTDRGVDFQHIGRGGDITFHGPGQLVCYLIINLRERGIKVRDFVALIEQAIISCLDSFCIPATTIAGLTGVWQGNTKLAAIGIEVKGGVSLHGLALNIATDLSFYELIVPCGIRAKQVGSMETVTGNGFKMTEVRKVLAEEICKLLSEVELGTSENC